MSLFSLLVATVLQAQSLTIHHINVGQGDATLFISPTGKTLLIDGGDTGKGTNKVLPYLQAHGIIRLDFVIASHYHADHIGGLDEVINGLGAGNVVDVYDRGTAQAVPTTVAYTGYAAAAATALGGRHTIATGTVLDLGGGVTIKCLAADGSVLGYGAAPNATSSENDLSTAWQLSFNEFQYFTGGDCGGETTYYADLETLIANYSGVGAVDALKVNHHGSKYSTNQVFTNALAPTVAVIPVGNGNTYFHPVQIILDRLAAANCYMYLTEAGNGGTIPAGHGVVANGDVVISTTGHNTYSVSYGTSSDSYTIKAPPTNTVSVSITPTTASLNTGGTFQFTASITGSTNTAVSWSASSGTVSTSGRYTAPTTAGTYSVTATSVADPSKSASATASVSAPVSINVAVSPATASISAGGTQQFTATVTGTTNTAVTWTCSGGTASASGLFTAPTTSGSYTVTATSAADPSKSATAMVTVTASPSTFAEVEPNNTRGTANVVGANVTSIVGYFPSISDNDDYFAVTLLAGHTLVVDMTGPTASSQDYDLYLYSSTGTQLASSTATGTTKHVSYKNTNISASKTIYIRVKRYASYSYVTPYTLVLSR
jgi:beta-lactamase superfamily II metal-dependent hydrolase